MNNTLLCCIFFCTAFGCSSKKTFPDISLELEGIKNNKSRKIEIHSYPNPEVSTQKDLDELVLITSDNSSLRICLPIILERFNAFDLNLKLILDENVYDLANVLQSQTKRENYLWKLFERVNIFNDSKGLLKSFAENKHDDQRIFKLKKLEGRDVFYINANDILLETKISKIKYFIEITGNKGFVRKNGELLFNISIDQNYDFKKISSVCEMVKQKGKGSDI